MRLFFQDGRKDQRINSVNPFERFESILGYILTAGRRKSFICDHKSVKLCLTCHLIRDHLKGYPKKADFSIAVLKGSYNKKPYKQSWIIWYNSFEPHTRNYIKEKFRQF